MSITIDINDYELDEGEVLSQISTAALEDELETRGTVRFKHPRDCAEALAILRENDCPSDIIRAVDDWVHTPIATSLKLRSWLALCGQAAGGEGC